MNPSLGPEKTFKEMRVAERLLFCVKLFFFFGTAGFAFPNLLD
jgi:hypothetical protein